MKTEDKLNLISLLEVMSHFEKEEIDKLKKLSLEEVKETYHLILLEKNDEMLEENK